MGVGRTPDRNIREFDVEYPRLVARSSREWDFDFSTFYFNADMTMAALLHPLATLFPPTLLRPPTAFGFHNPRIFKASAHSGQHLSASSTSANPCSFAGGTRVFVSEKVFGIALAWIGLWCSGRSGYCANVRIPDPARDQIATYKINWLRLVYWISIDRKQVQ